MPKMLKSSINFLLWIWFVSTLYRTIFVVGLTKFSHVVMWWVIASKK